MLKIKVGDFFPPRHGRTRTVIQRWRDSQERMIALASDDQESYLDTYLSWLTNECGIRVVNEPFEGENEFYFVFDSEEQMVMFKLSLDQYES